MKKILYLLSVLSIAGSLLSAEVSYSATSEWGWAGNFRDEYTVQADLLEMTLSAELGQFNQLKTDLLLLYDEGSRTVEWDQFILSTDLGSVFSLGGSQLLWENGFYSIDGGDEYSDFGIVGYASAGTDWMGLDDGLNTRITVMRGSIWGSAASRWNLGLDDTDPAVIAADESRQMQLYAGTLDLFPGLAFEAGARLDPDKEGITLGTDGAWTLDGDGWSLTTGGSYAFTTLSADDLIDLYGISTIWFRHTGGAGIEYLREFGESKAWYASLSLKGRDTASLIAVGGGAGVTTGPVGGEAAFSYSSTASAGEGTFEGLDISLFAVVEPVTFTLGYALTDGYGWSNNSTADLPATGGLYMNFEAVF